MRAVAQRRGLAASRRATARARAWGSLALGALALCLAPPVAHADSAFGMVYFGTVARLADARIEGRGGASLGYTDSLNAATTLATQLVDARRVTVTLGSQFMGRSSADPRSSLTRYDLVSPTLRVAWPLSRRIGMGTGFHALRTTQWTVVRPNAETPTVRETIEREGTQFEIPIELGVQLTRHVRVGGGLLIQRGTIRERYTADLDPGLVDPEDVREDVTTALGTSLAAAVYDVHGISLGGFWEPAHNANVDVERRGIALDARQEETRDDRLPTRWGVGARLGLWGAWSVGADMVQELWSQYRGRSSFEQALQDDWQFSAGIERAAGPRRTALRAGGFYRQLNYTLQGHDVREWGATLGTSIGLLGGGSRADIAVGYGIAGSLSENALEEKTWRLVFSFTGSEKWF